MTGVDFLARVGGMSRLLTDEEIGRQLGDLSGWTREGDEITASYEAPDFPAAIRLVDEVAVEAEDMQHHPDIDIRWRTVKFVLSTAFRGWADPARHRARPPGRPGRRASGGDRWWLRQ